MSGNKIIKGVAVLGVAGLIVKLLGAVFRIPLQGMIGEEGMAYFAMSSAPKKHMQKAKVPIPSRSQDETLNTL